MKRALSPTIVPFTTLGESEELPEEATIEFKILPIEVADELKTLSKEAKKTPPEEETDPTPENPPSVAEQDEMPYPCPKYNDEADVEAHVCAFLTTWQANHVSQRLAELEAEK